MQLLSEDKLIWSATVANSRMNRERNASGINSYEQDIHFKPETYLQNILNQKGKVAWLDLCCGQGKALLQVYQFFNQRNLSQKVKLVGVDLVKDFQTNIDSKSGIEMYITPLLEFTYHETFDLITCVHGLHYIGDKLKAIEKACSLLSDNGLFIANLDLNDIVIKSNSSNDILASLLKKNNFEYHSRKKLLIKNGNATINFSISYLGADDNHGKNYTGQESVKSYYSLK
ncbi:MAG: class I SAM-dependent methyltransferase [Raineya sp.]|jgi:SAM-dependent methyltransferase|nr:class I SAM-dependent methyltransferase [Raineya sp.]